MDHYPPYAMQGLENTLENELDRHIKIKQSFSKQNVFSSLIFCMIVNRSFLIVISCNKFIIKKQMCTYFTKSTKTSPSVK